MTPTPLPRRCPVCQAPTVIVNGQVEDDRPGRRDQPHACKAVA